MAKTKIRPNSGGILAALASSGVRDALEDAGETVAVRAKASAPYESGEYQDSIHVEMGEGYDRPLAYVIADADHSLIVEARTGNLLNAALDGDAG